MRRPTLRLQRSPAAVKVSAGWRRMRCKFCKPLARGAVFMGALTYIGNGPNFMIKAIAAELGYKMPSFFGYLACASAVLLPVFVLVTLVFFRAA